MRDNVALIESLATVGNVKTRGKKLRKKAKISQSELRQNSLDIFDSIDEKKCPIKKIDAHGTKFASMGMNFCNWMHNIGTSADLKDTIYITKYYRGNHLILLFIFSLI